MWRGGSGTAPLPPRSSDLDGTADREAARRRVSPEPVPSARVCRDIASTRTAIVKSLCANSRTLLGRRPLLAREVLYALNLGN
jgi:hypothetical protein